MRSFDDICAELRAHPDFLAACIWQKSDINLAMEHIDWGGTVEWHMSADEIWENMSIHWWEDTACEDGFEAIYMAMREMNAYDYKEEE